MEVAQYVVVTDCKERIRSSVWHTPTDGFVADKFPRDKARSKAES